MKRSILGNRYVWGVALLVAVFGLTAISTASACYVVAKCNTDNGEDWYEWRPRYKDFTVYFKGFEYLGELEITKREWNYGDGTGWYEGGTTGSCAYTTTGAKTATYRVTAGGQTFSDTCTVTVFHVVPNYLLWYFDGENPTNYHIEVTWTANGATTGTFKWQVIAGTTKVNLENDSDVITLTDDNQVGIKSTDASVSDNDVTIQFTYNNVFVINGLTEVYAPDHLTWWGTTDVEDPVCNYESRIDYYIKDWSDTTLPYNVEANEDWTTGVTHDTCPMDWRRGAPNGGMVSPTAFEDTIEGEEDGYDPEPQIPQNPLGSEKVYHWGQEFNIGSSTVGDGRTVKSHTLQKYRYHGRHE